MKRQHKLVEQPATTIAVGLPQESAWQVGLSLRMFNGSMRQRRARKGWSQKTLAMMAGVAVPYISAFETMKKRPSIQHARLIADALDCLPKDIWPDWLQPDATRGTVTVYRDIDEISFTALEARWKQTIYMLPAPDNMDESVNADLLQTALKSVLETLSPRLRTIIEKRFGLYDGRLYTLDEIADELGLTRERIRQLEAAALRRLRHVSRSKKLAAFVDEEKGIVLRPRFKRLVLDKP